MTNSDIPAWVLAGALAVGFGFLIGFGGSWGPFIVMAALATAIFALIGSAMRSVKDTEWLARWVLIGFLAKVVATWARHYVVAVLYAGGDAFRYHLVGTRLATEWQNGIPELTGQGGFGTQIVEAITGGMFAVYTPDLLGGFLMFSILAYGGQLMLYGAFRIWARPHQLKTYALMILFLPSFVFWPSSIGKDALVVFALGGAAYFASRVLRTFQLRWLIGLAPFLIVLGLIRIHIAALVVLGLVGATLLARTPQPANSATPFRRIVILAIFVATGALVLTVFPDIFGVDLTSTEEIDSFAAEVVRRTSEKGTVAAGEGVSRPAHVPEAIALVLFRPFMWEAVELQHFFAAAETGLLLGLTIWKLPAMARNWRSWRANGYVVFSTIYTVAFAVAFSVVRNLGIIARQRGQVLAFFLCVIVALGWEDKSRSSHQQTSQRIREAGSSRAESRPAQIPERPRTVVSQNRPDPGSISTVSRRSYSTQHDL